MAANLKKTTPKTSPKTIVQHDNIMYKRIWPSVVSSAPTAAAGGTFVEFMASVVSFLSTMVT
jgi:hypothetical protein